MSLHNISSCSTTIPSSNLPKDAKPNPRIRLNASKALTPAVRAKVHIAPWHRMARSSNRDTKVRQRSGTREDPATSRSAVGRAADGLVVLAHDGSGEVEERGARVGNRSADCSGGGGGADAVAAGAEFPVGFLRDGRVGQSTGVFGAVDEAEVLGIG